MPTAPMMVISVAQVVLRWDTSTNQGIPSGVSALDEWATDSALHVLIGVNVMLFLLILAGVVVYAAAVREEFRCDRSRVEASVPVAHGNESGPVERVCGLAKGAASVQSLQRRRPNRFSRRQSPSEARPV